MPDFRIPKNNTRCLIIDRNGMLKVYRAVPKLFEYCIDNNIKVIDKLYTKGWIKFYFPTISDRLVFLLSIGG